MDDTRPVPSAPPRHVGLALLLSFLCAGLGQIYAGRGRRGAVLLALALFHVPALFLLGRVAPSVGVLVAMAGLLVFGVALFVFVLVDAALCARRAPVPYVRRAYNNGWLYAALVVFSSLWTTGGMAWARADAFEAFRIPTESMAPTIGRGDRVLVNKQRTEDLRRGDVIVYRAPEQRDRKFIKRVIGLPGEEIRIEEGTVFVDGRALRLECADEGGVCREKDGARTWRVQWGPPELRRSQSYDAVVVPPDQLYVLGDHRINSWDSRRHGTVPIGDVLGVAEYVIWPGPEGRFGPLTTR